MPSTGTNTFTVTRDDIINATLRLLQVIGSGETPSREDYTNCSQALNIMIKSWANNERPLWVVQEVVLGMLPGVSSHKLGPTGGGIGYVNVGTGGTGYADTGSWSATGGLGTTPSYGIYTASGGAVTSMTVQDPGTGYSGTSIIVYTLDSGAGNATFGTSLSGIVMSRPLKIETAFIRNISTNEDTDLQLISRREYDILGAKSSPGIPNQFYYDNQIPNGNITFYNVSQDFNYEVHMKTIRMYYDMTTGTDEFDFPQEFFQALKWGLAAELYLEYPVNEKVIQIIEMKSEKYINDAFDNSVEEAPIFFTIDQRMTVKHE